MVQFATGFELFFAIRSVEINVVLPKSELNRRRAFKGRGEKWCFGELSRLLLSSSKGMSVEGKGR